MTVKIEAGSTNVYADLGYLNATEMQRKSSAAAEVVQAIKARHLTHEAAADLLGIDRRMISKVIHGQFRSMDEAMMLYLAAKLGQLPEALTRRGRKLSPKKRKANPNDLSS